MSELALYIILPNIQGQVPPKIMREEEFAQTIILGCFALI